MVASNRPGRATRSVRPHQCECFIAPPHILAQMAESDSAEDREAALRTLSSSAAIRSQRELLARVNSQLDLGAATAAFGLPTVAPQPPTGPAQQAVYDVHHGGRLNLPGQLERSTGDAAVADKAVNEAFDSVEATYAFYRDVFQRNSIDGSGMQIISSVHYGTGWDNAAWMGTQMVYGDGSRLFKPGSLTSAIDIIGHELTHGVTQVTAGLEYQGQSGALNESWSDVMGSLVKQKALGQTADEADWLIGEGILGAAFKGKALRSMKAPGTAFTGDQQPDNMSNYVDLPADNDPRNDSGGVHINSGIPNHAFYLVAVSLGGNAWERAGRIWYETLTKKLTSTDNFVDAANATVKVAGSLYEIGSPEEKAVSTAWHDVGVL